MPMKTIEGYSKEKYTNTSVLLAGGGAKALSDFIGSLSWDSTNKKIKYTPVGGSTTDLVTLSWDNIANKPTSLPANGGNADTSNRTKFLETFQQNSTTNTYGSQYPIWAQWSDSTNVRLKCTNYTVWTDKANYANSAGTTNSLGSGALKYMCSLYAGSTYNAYKIITDWHKSSNIMPTINIRGYAYGTSRTIDCDIVMYHYNNDACNYSLTNKGSYPIRVWQAIENDVQVFYINPGEYFGMFNVFVYGGMSTDAFSNWSMTTVDSVSGTEIGSVPIATSITGNADTVDGQHFSYSNDSNSPIYLWATNSNGSSFLADRGSINVNYANSAGSASSATQATNLIPENTAHYFRDPNNSSWRGGMIWGSTGSESMSFVVANSGTRFQFVGGSDIANWNSGTWQSANPYLTIYSNGIVTPGSATASGFIKSGSSDSYVLLGGGGHKLISDFATAEHTHDGRYLRYEGWWSSGSGQNVDDANGMTFVYGDHGSPNGWGILCTFDYTYNSGYKFQLFAEGYSASGMYYRCRSSDRGGWTSWKTVIDSGNIGSQSVSYASSAGSVSWGNITGKPFNWSGQSGQPTWLWGSNDGTNYYVWDPSNFSVNYANSAGSASSSTCARYLTCPDTRSSATAPGDYTATSTGVSFDFKESSVTGLSGYSGVMTFRPYASGQDWTGGEVHQIAFLAGGGLYHRIGTSSWDSWERILTSSNWSSYISIPSVGNGTVTVTQAGSTIGSFTMNQSGNTLIALNDTNTNYYPIRSYTSGLQISSYSGSTDCALYVPYATDKVAGVISTATQSFAGQKTFLNGIKVGSTSSDQSTDNAKIYFGDGKYVWIGESPQDDALMLNCGTGKNIYFSFAGSTAVTSSNYTTYAKIYMSNSGAVYASSGFYESSDERLKRILNPVKVNLDDLSKLRKVYYLWRDKSENGRQLGMIAQDVQKLYPELVSTDKNTGYLSLAYDKLSVIALEAIDTLYEEYKQLKERVNELEKLLHSK